MGDVELHADYDRDGRLTGSDSEYAARAEPPGAIVGVNLDCDGRKLPDQPRAGDRVLLDSTRPTRLAQDDELLPIAVRIAQTPPFGTLRLRIDADDAGSLELLDENRRAVAPAARRSRSTEYLLPRDPGEHRYFLEASRIPGAPHGAPGGAFTVSILGDETVLDMGHFTVAPFFVLDDGAPVEAVYVCRAPDNGAAINDLKNAVGDKLRIVETEDCAADAWMQDQFQLGYVSTPRGTTRLLLHLPRVRRNTQAAPPAKDEAAPANLAQLVRAHFPSDNLGLIEGLWDRTVEIHHAGGSASVTIEESEELFRIAKGLAMTEDFLRSMIDRMSEALGEPAPPWPVPPLPPARSLMALQPLLFRLRKLAPRVIDSGRYEKKAVDAMLERATAKVRDVRCRLGWSGGRILLATSRDAFRMSDAEFDALLGDLARIHDAVVYGGNIEASPPSAAHRFGKLVVGSAEERVMDPPVRELFAANEKRQPVVEIDTSWLTVAHVDELIAFVDAGRLAILRAAPELASRLLFAATELYESEGGVETWAAFHPHLLTRHDMNLGKHPITRMFRGKYWLHAHPPREGDKADGASSAEGSEPPQIYLNLVGFHATADPVSPVRYLPGSDLPRDYYPAKMTIWEAMYFENVTEAIARTRLEPLDEKLREELPELPIHRVPVIFDDAPLVDGQLSPGATGAFTPNLVNLQRVGDQVLIPNPFGPRMSPADAAQVISTVLREEGLYGAASKATPDWFAGQNLDVLEVWMNAELDGMPYKKAIRTVAEIADEFADSFPAQTAARVRQDAIRNANRDRFDGQGVLKRGWQRIRIPGRSVDFFQAYTHAILVSLECKPAWIDTWYYHVRLGEIHCGTNVLRSVPPERRNWWR